MSKQSVGDEEVDLGTSVSGDYWFFAPTGVVVLGPVPNGNPEFTVIAGVGIGIGYIIAQGDMFLTEGGSNEYLVVDEKGVGIAANLLLEAHYWNLMTRLSFGATVLGDDYATYEIHNLVWEFGYKVSF
jgi:hypothetical protein